MVDVQVERQGRIPLAETVRAYTDSSVALLRAREYGMNADAEVLTTAPGILVDDSFPCRQADAHLSSCDIWALDRGFTALQNACQGAFGDPDIDLLAARYATLEFQAPVGKAAILEDSDFELPVTVVELSSQDPDLDRMIRSPLAELLASNPNLSVLSVPIETLPRPDDPRAPSPTFLQRVKFSGLDTIAYRLVERFCTRHNLSGPRGRFVVLRENELCKETAWSMILRGFFPITLPVAVPSTGQSQELEAAMRDTARALIVDHIAPLLRSNKSVDALADLFSRGVAARVQRFRDSIAVWEQRLESVVKPGKTAVLTNWLNDPELLGLKHALRGRNVPMVFFQHGVTNEFNWRMRQYEAQYGTAVCDLELSFNSRGASISEKTRFGSGRAAAVGFPKDYYRGMKGAASVDKSGPPIWYICTAFYVANHGQLEGVTDWQKCRHESDIVTKVLDRCDHGVVFKPYPGRRFEDPDPIETAVANSTNVEMHRTRLDLRYVVRQARILISARSFSTPSWCLATGLPLVHIDIPDQDPLDEEAYDAFDKGVFLFSAAEPDFHDQLLTFLNQPIEQIERLWEEKRDAREALMNRFISSYPRGAGARAAKEVIREIRSARG